jgi:branched-chain amino acid transport system permease protein
MSGYTIVLMSTILMYVTMSVSWNIFCGSTGYVSLASAAFFGIGIYSSALFGGFNLPLPVLMLIGGLISFVLALLLGAATLRLRGVYFTIFTFGLGELLKNFVLWYEITYSGLRGRTVVTYGNTQVFMCMLGMAVIVIIAAFLIKRSRLGLALMGIGMDEDAAAHAGINTTFTKVITFAITSFAVGAVGAAKATTMIYVDPPIAFNMLMSFMPVLMVIFGGMNSFVGPVIGAIAFTLIQEKLTTEYPQWYMIIFGTIMVLSILFLPNGLMGLVKKFRFKRKEETANANT